MKIISKVLFVTLFISLGSLSNQAWGAGANSGKVVLVSKKPSSKLSVKEARRFASQYKIEAVKQNEEQEWTFYALTILRKPLNDFDLEVVLYDISRGQSPSKRRLIKMIYHHTLNSDSRSISGKVKLTRPEFDANRTYLLVVQSSSREFAKVLFRTKGVRTQEIKQGKHLANVKQEMAKANADLARRVKEEQQQAKKDSAQDK